MDASQWFILSRPAGLPDATPEQVRGPFQHAETAHAVRREMDNNDKMHDQEFSVVSVPADLGT